MNTPEAAKSLVPGFHFDDDADQAKCAVFGCGHPSEALVVIRFPHRWLLERKMRGKPDEVQKAGPLTTATIGMCRQCAVQIAAQE